MEILKKTFTGLLSTAYGMDETAVASLFNEDGSDLKTDAFDILKAKDQDRVTSLKGESKTKFDDGYKKGQSESLTKLENDIKGKFGAQSDKKGIHQTVP